MAVNYRDFEEKNVKRTVVFLLALCPALLLTACNREAPTRQVINMPNMPSQDTPAPMGNLAEGAVVETMDSGGYTYVQVDTGEEKIWAAAPESTVAVGDQIVIPEGAPMENFHSDTLKRDFERIYFVSNFRDPAGQSLSKGHGTTDPSGSMDGQPGMPGHGMMGHGMGGPKPAPEDIDLSGLEKAEGGMTVGEVYQGKANLADKEVTLRGKVVKYNPQIMGKNWLHVRDGSGEEAQGTHDLTVTTNVDAKVGDTVLVTGNVHLDKDFGYGYKYDVIIEDAQVTVE